jgi:hypothetical protein
MKCSHPDCSRGIGLVSHQRSLLDKRRFCSKKCRHNFVKEKRFQKERRTTSYFEWLMSLPAANPRVRANVLRDSYLQYGRVL